MRLFTDGIWKYLRSATTQSGRSRKPKQAPRLQVELLEDRLVPAANASGTLNGLAFIDANGNGLRGASELSLSGVVVKLTGKTTANVAVNLLDNVARAQANISVTAKTDASGAYHFFNVLPGTYKLTAGLVAGVLNSGTATVSNITITGGQTLNRNLAFKGVVVPTLISLQQFLTNTTPTNFLVSTPGSGRGLANFRSNSAPVISKQIDTVTVAKNTANATVIDLAGMFSDPDYTNSQVTINITNGGVAKKLKVTLFDKTAPQTVANFFDYVKAGLYNDSIFSRRVAGFVLQGGGAKLANAAGDDLSLVAASPTAIPNEFEASNKKNTLAMAQSPGDPNSATDQFFFNLLDNSGTLNAQKFTVFGQLTDVASQTTLTTLAATATKNAGASAAAAALPSVDLAEVPLTGYTGGATTSATFPADAVRSNFMVINNITVDKQDEFLIYRVVSVTNPAAAPDLVTATLTNEKLSLSYAAGKSGHATVVVEATDRYGVSVQQTFIVKVNEPPTATVTLSPTDPIATAIVTANATSSDDNGDTVLLTYLWKINGTTVKTTPASASLTDTLNLADFGPPAVGAIISVTVTPNDGILNGTSANANVTVGI